MRQQSCGSGHGPRGWGRAAWLLAGGMAALGCSGEDTQSNASPEVGDFVADYATSEAFFSRMSEPAVGLRDLSPHDIVRIWYTRGLEQFVDAPNFVAPEGTVAIKALYDDEGAALQLLVMVKEPEGTAPYRGDWTFEVRGPDGQKASPDNQDFCVNCHADFPDTDWLRGLELAN